MNHKQTLRIATWNANGLDKERAAELELYLSDEKIDICLISETHFTKESFSKIRGYDLYHTPHPAGTPRGGSAVIIKQNIKHHVATKIVTQQIQLTAVSVNIKQKNVNIGAIYCPPGAKLKKEDYMQLFVEIGPNFILGGDFNAKHEFWGSRLTWPKGKELLAAGLEMNCEFHSGGGPTYWPTDRRKVPDLIDFFITRGISSNYINTENSTGIASDHTPVVMSISETIILKDKDLKLTNKKTDWCQYRELLQREINLQVPIKTETELELELEAFVSNLQNAAWLSTQEEKITENKNLNYPLEIRELVSEKRKARAVWQRNRDPDSKKKLNKLCNELKAKIKEVKNETISNYLCNLTAEKSTEYSLWRATKRLKRPITQTPPIRKEDGSWARNEQQKAELFADYLEETFQPLPRQSANENAELVKKQDSEQIQTITMVELKNEIKCNLSPKKAPGYDLITGKMLKELPEVGLKKLLFLFNAAIRLKYIPKQWKIAEVIMICKPGKPANDKKSYRPISLLPVISKLFEKLLLKRLKPIIEKRKLIPQHQFGFRSKHSTIDQVHRIVSVIEKSLEEKKICTALFLDVAQAFDKVWHKGLLCKIHKTLPQEYYTILKSYINQRFFRIKCGGSYSTLKEIKAGVAQGSVIGPLLYLLYTSDLPQSEDTVTATFADDTALLAVGNTPTEATDKIQASINNVISWTKKWRIKLNEDKSVLINFTNRKFNPIPVSVNSKIIPYSNSAKYLGMTLDSGLRWKEHIKKKKEELNIKFKKMYWLLGRHSVLSTHNKLLIYKQVLKPVWTYGIQLWGCAKKNNINIMQTFQNKALRSIVNAPWYVRNHDLQRDLNIETVQEARRRFALKHEKRLLQHDNIEAIMLLDNSQQIRRLKRTKPTDLALEQDL